MKTNFKTIFATLAIMAASSLFANGSDLYKRCAGCHGIDGSKKALGKSQTLTGWDSDKTIKALKGYKDGSYGGAMKGVMKGQVTRLSDAEIEAIAAHIATLK